MADNPAGTLTATPSTAKSVRSHTRVALIMGAQIPIMVLVGYLSTKGYTLTSLWAVVFLSMLVFVMVLGDAKGRIGGILISERNVMSLSRFQLVAWTLLICSAFITVALARVFAKLPNPLAIQLPPELWQLLGISGVSSVGSALILQNKAGKQPAAGEVQKTAAATKEDPTNVAQNARGLNYANPDAKDAHFTDMFEGDELANTAFLDIGKVQMFFFTLITLIAYGTAIAVQMSKNSAIADFAKFPELASGLVALLGISHATYLGTKVPDQTKTA
jgi:hypothetical protein